MWTQKKPCDACPYRRDTPVGIWSREEYERLKDNDRLQFGPTYGCHLNSARLKDEEQPCVGWLADQKRRGTPSISLRMVLMTNDTAGCLYGEIDENDPNLYQSIDEMVRANAGRRFPVRAPKAKRLMAKLSRGAR